MKATIPLIRAGSLAPLVKWMERRGRAVDKTLALAGVTCDPVSEPDRLIPMWAVAALFRDVAASAGCPDLGWRIIGETSVGDLGRLGLLVLSERTPADAFRVTSKVMANFCSHEHFDFTERQDCGVIVSTFSVTVDSAALHQAQLHTLALIRSILTLTGKPERSFFTSISIPPHPVFGLSHLPADLARVAKAAPDDAMTVTIGRSLLQSNLKHRLLQTEVPKQPESWECLRGAEVGFTQVIRNLIAGALPDGPPTAELMARNAGVTLRTLQRRLNADNTTFRELVDESRRRLALEQISGGSDQMGEISVNLGYTSPASLSRAVKRWTDHSPSDLRKTIGQKPKNSR